MLTTTTLLLFAPLIGAQDWARFRGPAGAGHASTPTSKILLGTGPARWKVELPGTGHSSPVVVGETIYVTSELADNRRVVLALATGDGSERWRFESSYEPLHLHQLNSPAAATPPCDGERVYVSWPTGRVLEVLALDAGTGVLRWRKVLGGFAAQHGGGSSPVVVDDVLVVANDNEGDDSFIVGLDSRSGEERWRRPRTSSRASYATPTLLEREGETPLLLFASTAHGLTCLEALTGELVWEAGGIFTERTVASPVVVGDLVFVSAGSGGGGKECAAVKIPSAEEDKAAVAWRLRRALPYVPTPLAVGELLFLWSDSGIVTCVRAARGEVLWTERLDGRFFASPVRIGGHAYNISMEGRLYILATTEEYHPPTVVDLEEPSQASPAVADGVLYIRTERHLSSHGISGEEEQPR